jgi:hypothetical protein
MVARLVQALALGAWQGAANRAVPQQVVVGGEQPDPPQFCHTDTDAQHADGGSVKAPQAGHVRDRQWFYQSQSRRW